MGYKVKKIYQGTNLVRPATWKPNANTQLYLPFTNNYNDAMGNTMSLRLGTAPTYSTTSQGEVYANINSCNIGTTLNSLNINNFTVSQWIYKTSTSVDVVWYFGGNVDADSSSNTGYGTGLFINNKRLVIYVWLGDIDTGVDITLNAWHNIIFTISNSTTKIYVDGDLKKDITKSYTKGSLNSFRIFSNPFINPIRNPFKGRYDELIVESKVWDAAEIKSYYNQTKSNYGL